MISGVLLIFSQTLSSFVNQAVVWWRQSRSTSTSENIHGSGVNFKSWTVFGEQIIFHSLRQKNSLSFNLNFQDNDCSQAIQYF